jgi:hypothetical protein
MSWNDGNSVYHLAPAIHQKRMKQLSLRERVMQLSVTAKYGFLIQCVVSLIAFLLFALPIHSGSSRMLGWLIVQVSVISWFLWDRRGAPPVLPIICSLYAVYFSLPLFYLENVKKLQSVFEIHEPLTLIVLFMVLTLQLSIVLGWMVGGRKMTILRYPMDAPVNRLLILAYLIIAVQFLLQYLGLTRPDFDLGNAKQLVNGIFNPYLALGILFYVSQTEGWNVARLGGIIAIFILSFIASVSSTMLGEMILPLVILGMLTVGKNPKRVVTAGAVLGFIVVLVQPAKLEYRTKVLELEDRGIHLGIKDKVELYATITLDYWNGTRIGKYYDETAATQTGKRFALLHLLEILVEETPDRVPFQYGKTFEFLLYAMIPRVIFPEKPMAQEANVWFAKEYGLLDAEIAKRTMIGVSHLGEVYLNFGFFGIPPIFFLFGFVVRRIQRGFSRANLSTARKSVVVGMLPQFFTIESTLTGFISGLALTYFLSHLVVAILSMKQPSGDRSPG